MIGVSEEMMNIFMRYNWPGNIRELENLLVRAMVVAKGQVLVRGDFPELTDEGHEKSISEPEMNGAEAAGLSLTLDAMEERHIRHVLKRNSTLNKGEICDLLGISRPTFERKLEKYGITFERE